MPDKSNPSVLRAASTGEISSVRNQLKQGADPNEKDSRGRTPLHWACQAGQLKIVQLLIEFGAQIDATDDLGFTPLVIAAGEGNCEVVRELIKAGAHANIRVHSNSDGNALHLASAWDRFDVVKLLVETTDVDINARDRDGKTPLALVMEPGTTGEIGDKELGKYLIHHGAVL